MIDKIDDQLKRSGSIDDQIEECIYDAIRVYQPHRFRFSESRTVGQFNTVTGQEYYTAADNASIATLYQFDYVVVQIGTAQYELSRLEPKDIELMTQTGTQRGQPHSYCYFDKTIRFYPVPSGVYPITVAAHNKIVAPATVDEIDNPWMTDAERLIRCRARYELAVNYGIGYKGGSAVEHAALMHPETGATADAFAEMKRDTNKLTGTGRFRPTNF